MCYLGACRIEFFGSMARRQRETSFKGRRSTVERSRDSERRLILFAEFMVQVLPWMSEDHS